MTEDSRLRVSPTNANALLPTSTEPERSTIDAPSEGENMLAAPALDELTQALADETRAALHEIPGISQSLQIIREESRDARLDARESSIRDHLQPLMAPRHDREIFTSAKDVLACITKSGEFARQIRIAAFLDEDHLRLRHNFIIDFRCSDGRCVDYHFMPNDLLHTLYAEEHIPQAGLIIIPNTHEITSVEGPQGVRAFFDANEAHITRILDSLLAEPITHELRWQEKYLVTHHGDPSCDIVKNKQILFSLKSHSSGADFLEFLDENGIQSAEGKALTVRDLLLDDGTAEDIAEHITENARHGCGAHGSWMAGALLESAKQALLIDEYVQRRFPLEHAVGKFRILRQHQFTGERTRNVLAQDVDHRMLDRTGTHIIGLPADFASAISRFNLTDIERQQAVHDGSLRLVEKEGAHELIEHNPTVHAEQIIAFTNNPGAYAIPNFDMLDQAWSDDPEKNKAIGVKLIDVALAEENFGGRNPGAKIFVLLDRPFRPDYRKGATWVNDWVSIRERLEMLPPDAQPSNEQWSALESSFRSDNTAMNLPLLFTFMEKLEPQYRLTRDVLARAAAVRRGYEARRISAMHVVQQSVDPSRTDLEGEEKGWNMFVKFDRVPITDAEELWLIEGDNQRSMELQKQLERDLTAYVNSDPHLRDRVEIVPVATNRRSYKVHHDLSLSGSHRVPPKLKAAAQSRAGKLLATPQGPGVAPEERAAFGADDGRMSIR